MAGCRKAVIAPGSDADLVVWNPEAEYVLSKDRQQSAADYCPLEGTRIKGRTERVYLRGTLVAENGEVLVPGTGKYVTASDGEIML